MEAAGLLPWLDHISDLRRIIGIWCTVRNHFLAGTCRVPARFRKARLTHLCSVEKLFHQGGPDCVGVAEGDKRCANDPLAACGRPDGVRAAHHELLNKRFSTKQVIPRF